MIKDPYKVLGVSANATDEEIKRAYRLKSKQWHPDQNLDNQEYAEARFKEVQEAYRQIVDARARGGSGYGDTQNGYAGSGNSSYQNGYQNDGYANPNGYGDFYDFFRQWDQYSQQQRASQSENDPNEVRAAVNYINNGMYQEALNALNSVPGADRNAKWYYLASQASSRMGNNVDALNYAKQACDLDPNNPQYAAYLQQMQSGGTWYQGRGASYGGYGSGASSWCLSMIALNLFCNCCLGGGRFI